MRKLLLLILLAIGSAGSLTACGSKFREQPDCGFQKNVYGERVSWKTNTPIRISIHNSVPAQFVPVIETAIRAWEDAAGKKLFELVDTAAGGELTPRQDGVNMIYWFTKGWDPKKENEQARTTVYYVSDEIREADMRINAQLYNYYVDKPANPQDLHLESLVIHELGHVLGLAHRADPGTVMATTLASSTVRDKISSEDRKSLICEY